jgi:hypothetical protein
MKSASHLLTGAHSARRLLRHPLEFGSSLSDRTRPGPGSFSGGPKYRRCACAIALCTGAGTDRTGGAKQEAATASRKPSAVDCDWRSPLKNVGQLIIGEPEHADGSSGVARGIAPRCGREKATEDPSSPRWLRRFFFSATSPRAPESPSPLPQRCGHRARPGSPPAGPRRYPQSAPAPRAARLSQPRPARPQSHRE